MSTLRVCIIGYSDISKKEINEAQQKLNTVLPDLKTELVKTKPDLILFASGGSEMHAQELLKESSFCILIADSENNSYAAASEVKAFANQNYKKCKLLHLNAPETKVYFHKFLKIKESAEQLVDKTICLIGEVSPWLIASQTHEKSLQNKFGIKIKHILWNELKHYGDMEEKGILKESFPTADQRKLTESEKVYELILETVNSNAADAVSVECFSMVKEHKVTACLALAQLCKDGISAGCEGDIPSTVGLLLAKEITGSVPWMANLASLHSEQGLFAHCTVSPDLIDSVKTPTHFETNEGLAVQGEFKGDAVTIFRFDESFSKMFLCETEIINRPKYKTACRTQIEVKLDKESVHKLRENPLGNHHIIVPGHIQNELELFAHFKGIEVI